MLYCFGVVVFFYYILFYLIFATSKKMPNCYENPSAFEALNISDFIQNHAKIKKQS